MLEALNHSKRMLPEQIAEQIIKMITEHQFKAGDRLPNEYEMAEQLSVGRGTIREAVKILVSRNILEIRRGCGTFVSANPGIIEDPLGFAFVKDKKRLALDLCEVRMIIEPEIAALAAERADREGIVELIRLAEEVEILCEKGLRHMEKDIEFHEMIAKCSKNQIMPDIIPIIQSGIAVFIDVLEPALTKETVRTHKKIVEAIQAHQPKKAKKAMIEHLANNQEKIERFIRKF